jgi:hypothetical protein
MMAVVDKEKQETGQESKEAKKDPLHQTTGTATSHLPKRQTHEAILSDPMSQVTIRFSNPHVVLGRRLVEPR